MLRSTRTLAFALALTFAASPSVALAQPHPAPPQPPPQPQTAQPPTIRSQLTGEALAAWDRGMNALDAQSYATALPEFKRAYELSHNPRVLINVGVCEKNLNDFVSAEKYWKEELAEGEGKLSPNEKQTLESYIATVHQFTTTLTVTANVPGAALTIDGQDEGKTPFLSPVAVNVGAGHQITLSADGYKPQTVTKDFTTGVAASVDFKLEPVERKTDVTVTVTGAPRAEIFIDGTDMGPAPFTGQVIATRHTFEARAPGFVTTRQTSDVEYQKPFSLALTMSPERHQARVAITTTPGDAVIEIDGHVVGATHWEGTLPSGGHQLIVRKQGYEPFSSELALRDDQVRTVEATLVEEQHARTWIWWTVGAVAVLAGGAVASYFVFKPQDQQPFVGTYSPGLTTGSFRFGR
jgi:hypothetical protein